MELGEKAKILDKSNDQYYMWDLSHGSKFWDSFGAYVMNDRLLRQYKEYILCWINSLSVKMSIFNIMQKYILNPFAGWISFFFQSFVDTKML